VAVWFWTSSPRADLGVAATLSAPPAERLAATASAKPIPIPENVEVTATIPAKPPAPPPKTACADPDALGVSRVVEINTTGGPGFGFEHFKQLDFLTDKEIVLTFDDGPWPVNTPSVLKTLADECTKAVFFPIGKHATYHPEILKQVVAAGHSVGTHTWSHANLNSKKMNEQQARDEIEKGFSAVKLALGAAPSPFFRFPQLQHSPAAVPTEGPRSACRAADDRDG
jgi:peptidoglycan/xylan/chitin deacetylase (PgdA/CDA1 family)